MLAVSTYVHDKNVTLTSELKKRSTHFYKARALFMVGENEKEKQTLLQGRPLISGVVN